MNIKEIKMGKQTIGEKISPILAEIENTLWEFEATQGTKPDFTIDGFRGATKIFMACLMDKIWELQVNERISMDDREKMAEKCGQDVRQLIKTYTDIDTFDLYK